MDLRLISFKLCRFVQRSVIALRHKGAAFELRYVDLADPPEWFLALSPAKKVPLLLVDGAQVIFESAVINEFIDEVTPGRLHPEDPIARALNRSWIEFGSRALMDTLHMTTAETGAAYGEVVAGFADKLVEVEAALGAGPCFNGADFSLVDTAYAPLFMRIDLIERHAPVLDWGSLPRVAAWSAHLLGLPAVAGSVVADFPALYRDLVRRRQGYLATRMEGAGPFDPERKSLY